MLRMVLLVFVLGAFSIFSASFDEIKERHHHFFSLLSNANIVLDHDSAVQIIDEHLADIVHEINELAKDHPKRLKLESLSAALGHPKKRQGLIGRTRKADHRPSGPRVHDETMYQRTFKKTLKNVLLQWITNSEFYKEEPDLVYRLSTLFEVNIDNAELEKLLTTKKLVFYLDRADSMLRYHIWPVILDYERIYRIEFMSVEGGNKMTNAFGHSAIRIVLCDPARENITEECLLDTAFHVVLMFRADISKQTPLKKSESEYDLLDMPQSQRGHLNPFKAIIGSYPSRPFLTSLNEALDQYLEKEGRTIITIPLDLNREQIMQFTHQLMRVLKYNESYEFFNTNCATEVRTRLLQTFVEHPKIFEGSPISPDGVIKNAYEAGIIASEWPVKNMNTGNLLKMEQQGLAFVPYKKKLCYHFNKLKMMLKYEGVEFSYKLREFLSNDSERRYLLYENIVASIDDNLFMEEKEAKKWAILFLMEKIEQEIKRQLNIELNKQALEWFNGIKKEDILTDKEDAYYQHEMEISEATSALLNRINAEGNQVIVKDNDELIDWEHNQKHTREMLSENWRLKRQLNLPANSELNRQEEIFNFLALNNSQKAPPESPDREPDYDIDDAHDETDPPPFVELNIPGAE